MWYEKVDRTLDRPNHGHCTRCVVVDVATMMYGSSPVVGMTLSSSLDVPCTTIAGSDSVPSVPVPKIEAFTQAILMKNEIVEIWVDRSLTVVRRFPPLRPGIHAHACPCRQQRRDNRQ